jgi:hypothetical protein
VKLETLSVNGYDIVLPVGLEQTMNTPVRDSYQSFLQESTKDVRRHLTCLTSLLPRAIRDFYDNYDRIQVLHAFGGLGASAQVILKDFPWSEHKFMERDPTCAQYLFEHYPPYLHRVDQVDDSMPFLATGDLDPYHVILLDMSVGTIKTKGVKEMWTNVAKSVKRDPRKVVWFTDTSCHKIHLNYKTYAKDFGVDIDPTAASYLHAYAYWLEQNHGLTISAAMREAGEFYCVVHAANIGIPRFNEIPYV